MSGKGERVWDGVSDAWVDIGAGVRLMRISLDFGPLVSSWRSICESAVHSLDRDGLVGKGGYT